MANSSRTSARRGGLLTSAYMASEPSISERDADALAGNLLILALALIREAGSVGTAHDAIDEAAKIIESLQCR